MDIRLLTNKVSEHEILQILDLQNFNYRDTLSKEKQKKNGFTDFLSTPTHFKNPHFTCLVYKPDSYKIGGYVMAIPSIITLDNERLELLTKEIRKNAPEFIKSASVLQVYVDSIHRGKGVGKELYQRLFLEMKQKEFQTLAASIDIENERGLQFHEEIGFAFVGKYEDNGRRFQLMRKKIY